MGAAGGAGGHVCWVGLGAVSHPAAVSWRVHCTWCRLALGSCPVPHLDICKVAAVVGGPLAQAAGPGSVVPGGERGRKLNSARAAGRNKARSPWPRYTHSPRLGIVESSARHCSAAPTRRVAGDGTAPACLTNARTTSGLRQRCALPIRPMLPLTPAHEARCCCCCCIFGLLASSQGAGGGASFRASSSCVAVFDASDYE